ncbi:MAG: NUDIX domain-containing protein [Patescibacteria group bacterium]|nr:NUDIX domain-containing protein [Patescibacteria group bacterium]MDD5121707.1 NUDIX domain-containing protein [Patescibacteria group bacterium]MDD5221702.1 NUDIX domain-containing protein [Patescibacteria group bacterium]MDD5396129.1 NUDIX domain-containing protein [Patescibacteria group bacterium]
MTENRKIGAGIGIMILKDGKVLLGHRHEDAEKASSALHGEGTWTMPGGKLDFGESFEDGCRREVKEEIGVKINSFNLISVTNDVRPDAHFVTMGFLCDDFTGEPKIMEPDEITEWRWFELDKLPSPIFPPSMAIIKNYLAKKVYQPYL